MVEPRKKKRPDKDGIGERNGAVKDRSAGIDANLPAGAGGTAAEAAAPPQEEVREEPDQKYLRLLAEFDNYKKRTARQFEEITRLANERIMGSLLDILDNFARALDAGGNAEDPAGLLKGVKLIYSQFQDILRREGLVEIDAESKPFDPRYHEAVLHVTTDKLKPDMVVEEIQKGYMLGDKVIRASRVAVSREPGPPETGRS